MTTNGKCDDPGRGSDSAHAPTVNIFGRRVPMPRSRAVRIPVGVLLVLFGTVGFLPVLGYWMIPAGLLVLSYDIAMVRRWRRRTASWWGRRRRKNGDRR